MTGGRDFAGLAAVVTGGAAGIGLATARMLVARGARVAVLDRDVSPLVGDGDLSVFAADVGDDASVVEAVRGAPELSSMLPAPSGHPRSSSAHPR
ncbi:SDR family NAD(P)-dependent oxidoreductase [Embleya sp. NBC_00888]|uniref:SDR family NAD(P)-dependent oxidoreductase n=1 Tax=Embleya sp. NBC_00888 TaxID=2975960 RepID=UPI00386AF58A